MSLKYNFGLFVNIVFLLSCDSSRVYEKNTDIEDFIWEKDKKIIHNFAIEDTAVSYNLLINFRHTIHYQFQNIYLQYELKSPDGEVISKLMNIQLADVAKERWNGDILGDIIDITSPVNEFQNHKFHLNGNYRITLEQFMREDKLIGVMAIGVRVERKM